MSTAFNGLYDFDAWDTSIEFMIAFIKARRTSGNKIATTLERENFELFCNIQNSFHSAVNAFTVLERKHDEIVGKIKPGREETKVHDHIVRIIVLLKIWLLQIEQGYCMGTKDKKHPETKWICNKASYYFGYMEN